MNETKPILTRSRDSQNLYILNNGDRSTFMQLLEANNGILIFKFTANWCGPCKTIKTYTIQQSNRLRQDTILIEVDVDDCFDLYSFLKQKKMVNGIPVFLCYKKGNTTFAPDDSITGANIPDLNLFFERCSKMVLQ
jgi:thiol:disulfide interchange protein